MKQLDPNKFFKKDLFAIYIYTVQFSLSSILFWYLTLQV